MSGSAKRGGAAARRSATAGIGVLLLRRARVDLALLVVLAVVLVLASGAAALAPRVLARVVDAGARSAVAGAGSAADLLVEAPVGRPRPNVSVIPPSAALALASSVPAGLPAPLHALAAGASAVVVGPPVSATAAGGRDLQLRVGAVDDHVRLHTVSGRLPAASNADRLEVVVGRDAAKAASIAVGDELRYMAASGHRVALHVVGLVAPADASARRVEEDLPGLWSASVVQESGAASGFAISALTSPQGALALATLDDEDPWTGRVRVPFDAGAFTAGLVPRVADAIDTLAFSPGMLADVPVDLRIESGFRSALQPFEHEAVTASAQLALAVTGAVAVALAVVVLLMRLLVRRRRAAIVLERSRGASVAALVIGALVEAVGIAVPAAAVGLVLSRLLPDPGGDPLLAAGVVLPVLLVAAVAVVAAAVLTAASAAGALRGTTRARPTRSRVRPIAEGTTALLAIAAFLAVRARGLQASEAGVDPLLVAAPVLVAATAALVAIRVHPFLVRAAARLAARGRGALGVVATAHAEQSLTALPLAVLALAVGVAVGGVLLTDAVHRGQADAAWRVVGADAHVTGDLPVTAAAALDARPGVTAAAGIRVEDEVSVDTGADTALVTLLAVDRRYPALLARLPQGLGDDGRRALTRLDAGGATAAEVPALVSAGLRDRVAGTGLRMRLGSRTVALRVVGVLDVQPGGLGDPPVVTVSRSALAAASGAAATPTDLLTTGPGAERAASALAGPGVRVRTRSAWLDAQQRLPLVGGVTAVTAIAAAVAEGFAAAALVAEVVAGAARRRRIAALLATVGVSGRVPRLLLLAEVGPVALGALVAGLVAGAVVAFGLGPVLGLDALTDGVTVVPALSAPVLLVALLGVVPAVVLAGVAESLGARRLRPATTLRSGGAP